MITYLLVKRYLGDDSVPLIIRCIIACIPSAGMIGLGIWTIIAEPSWQAKALGGFLIFMFLLFAGYFVLKLCVDDEKRKAAMKNKEERKEE